MTRHLLAHEDAGLVRDGRAMNVPAVDDAAASGGGVAEHAAREQPAAAARRRRAAPRAGAPTRTVTGFDSSSRPPTRGPRGRRSSTPPFAPAGSASS